MSSFLKIVLYVLIFFVVMLLISWLVPDVNKYVHDYSGAKKLPIWLVGLFGPIAYLFNKIGKMFGGIFGTNVTEKQIEEKAQQVEDDRKKIWTEIDNLIAWRRDTINKEITEIDGLNKKISALQERSDTLWTEIEKGHQQLQSIAPSTFQQF
jgi:uncharacterized protein involved in cysteine biosynthesis